jgi:predicted GIY-YIG superfamily endonuclease
MSDWYCYILQNTYDPHKNRTYNGSTNNPKKRLRQHNQELVGGAKYTKKFGKSSWEIYALLTGFPTRQNALQCEWKIKYPNKKDKKTYIGKDGRIIGLIEVLKSIKWTENSTLYNKDMNLTLWISTNYQEFIEKSELPANISIIFVDDIMSLLFTTK